MIVIRRLQFKHWLLILVLIALLAAGFSFNSRVSASVTPQAGTATSISVNVNANGVYSLSAASTGWTFGGNIGHSLANIVTNTGTDTIGSFHETTFNYTAGSSRAGAIRSYDAKPVILFTDKYLSASSNSAPFPVLTTYPQNLYHLTYNGSFAVPSFSKMGFDSPWIFFDGNANTFIFSPASNFQQAFITNTVGLSSGIISSITSFPAGFTQQTMLVVNQGINGAYQIYGQAMTDHQGKIRPANDADIDLNKFGYWTDNGGYYWYNYDTTKGYAGTILAIRDYFKQINVPLGYMQLDSWWYPKGPNADWAKTGYGNGEYTYTAAPQLFPNGLTAFQQQLGLPMVTHARWIDTASPYRNQYKISNNVSIDPKFWQNIMGYIHNANVIRYEQDWLSGNAQPTYNLTDPNLFFDNMASAAQADGLTLQYCMGLPRDFLQSTRYSNLTTIRVSNDRFERGKWKDFLYTSNLAGSLGVWPWADVYYSTEQDNNMLATLSAGQVGVGDQIGTVNRANIMQSIRSDGVIVKPDVPIVPTDQSYINDARGLNLPEVAATYTDFGSFKAHYVFAYNQDSTNLTASWVPATLGLTGKVYIYNYYTGLGSLVDATSTYSEDISGGQHAYYIVVPVGASNIGFLGDKDKIVALGKKRVSQVSDDGTLHATINFASGEGNVTIHGYAASQPTVSATTGSVTGLTYNQATGLFSAVVNPGTNGTAQINLKAAAGSGAPATLSPITYQTENLTVAGTSGATERVFADTNCSGGNCTSLDATKVGDFVTFTTNVPQARTYDIHIGVKKSNDRGTFQFASNGINHGAPQDLYANTKPYDIGKTLYIDVDLGPVAFASTGNKSFTFTVTGKNSASSGYVLSLDYITLIPQ